MSLRTSLIVLAVLAAIPALVVAGYIDVRTRDAVTAAALGEALRHARAVVDEHADRIERGRHLLIALAHVPMVRTPADPRCPRFLGGLLREYGRYAGFGVAALDGRVVCSAPAFAQPVTLADRPIFRDVVRTNAFAVGEYIIGRVSGRPSLGLAHPVTDESGRLAGVVYASLDVGRLNQALGQRGLPAHASLTLLDRNGVVFGRFPEPDRWMGRNAADWIVWKDAGGPGTLDAEDLDGRRRLYGRATLGGPRRHGVVAVGLDRDHVLASASGRAFRPELPLVLFAVAAIVLVWCSATLLVGRPMQALLATTRRFGGGELRARAAPAGSAEVREMAEAFNAMAESLERRTVQAELAEKRYRGLFERNLAGMYRTLRNGRVIECNPAFARMLGYRSVDEVMAVDVGELYADALQREELLARLAPGAVLLNQELRLRRRDGRVITVLAHMTEVAAPDWTFLEGMMIDITDRIRAEAAERSAGEFRAVTRIANTAAHEINNPLAAIVGNLELLSRKLPGAAPYSEPAQRNAFRIKEIVGRMQRLTRLEPTADRPELPQMLDIVRSSDVPPDPGAPGADTGARP